MAPYHSFESEMVDVNNNFNPTFSTQSGANELLRNNSNKNRDSHNTHATNRNLSKNGSSTHEGITFKKPLHKLNIGGPRSSFFVPIVRLPSSDAVGHMTNNRHERFNGKNNNEVASNWLSRGAKHNNAESKTNTLEHRFRPIVGPDERIEEHDISSRVKKELIIEQVLIKKELSRHRMPVVDISFYDDESLSTLSSMGYDGSEHDLDAIFQYDNNEGLDMYIIDEEYIEARNDNSDQYVTRIDDKESRQGATCDYLSQDIANDNFFYQNKTDNFESIEKDPDLSLDLSLDGDDNMIMPIGAKVETEASENIFNKEVIENLISGQVKKMNSARQEIMLSSHTPMERRDAPPPLTEISIPITHDYGYGYYLKPLWNMERESVEDPCKYQLERTRSLIKEGRKRRNRKELVKLVFRVNNDKL